MERFAVRREHDFLILDDKNGICGKLGEHLTKMQKSQDWLLTIWNISWLEHMS